MGVHGRDEVRRLAPLELDEPLVAVIGLSEWAAEIALGAGFLIFPADDAGRGARGEEADREQDGGW